MKFVMTYNIHNESWDAAVSRFLETQAPAPEGVKLLGRWHAAAAVTAFSCSKARTSPPSTGSRLSGTMCATCR